MGCANDTKRGQYRGRFGGRNTKFTRASWPKICSGGHFLGKDYESVRLRDICSGHQGGQPVRRSPRVALLAGNDLQTAHPSGGTSRSASTAEDHAASYAHTGRPELL